jgi:hypothetical protein
MEAFVDDPNIFELETKKRDRFFLIWKEDPYDLCFFTRKESDKMKKRLKWDDIQRMPELDNVPTPKIFMKAVKDGKVDPALFEQYGAVLAMQCVLGFQKKAERKRAKKEQIYRNRGEDIDYDIVAKGHTADGRPLAQGCKLEGSYDR